MRKGESEGEELGDTKAKRMLLWLWVEMVVGVKVWVVGVKIWVGGA